ncbi:MAG: hypothetical protein EBU66_19090, partial [Bacteroidetes bacterium]|nr:hypothetical protein [Bacteroidota bacterium]
MHMNNSEQYSFFVTVIKKRFRSIVLIAFISGALGYGISWIIPHAYLSTVMVLPAEQKNSGMGLASLLSGSLPSGL